MGVDDDRAGRHVLQVTDGPQDGLAVPRRARRGCPTAAAAAYSALVQTIARLLMEKRGTVRTRRTREDTTALNAVYNDH